MFVDNGSFFSHSYTDKATAIRTRHERDVSISGANGILLKV